MIKYAIYLPTFDPYGSPRIIAEVKKLQRDGRFRKLEGIWVTHYHNDHTGSVAAPNEKSVLNRAPGASPMQQVADGDIALGMVVRHIMQSPVYYNPATGANYPFSDVSHRPFPQWGAVLLEFLEGRSDYNAMDLTLTKRFSNRWQGRVSYVYSQTNASINNTGSNSYGQSSAYETPTLALVNNYGHPVFEREDCHPGLQVHGEQRFRIDPQQSLVCCLQVVPAE